MYIFLFVSYIFKNRKLMVLIEIQQVENRTTGSYTRPDGVGVIRSL